MISLLRAWIQPLVGEQRSHKPCGVAEREKNNKLQNNSSVLAEGQGGQKEKVLLTNPFMASVSQSWYSKGIRLNQEMEEQRNKLEKLIKLWALRRTSIVVHHL